MRFLLTNDDGIEAPGIAALAEAVTGLGSAVIVAPRDALSGCSHQVTTHRPLELHDCGGRYAVDGLPADCVRVGLWQVAPQAEWVLSGVNAGGNLGADVYHSGTVAAVREAALLGRRGIAVSQYFRRDQLVDWATSAAWTRAVLEELLDRPLRPRHYWNVNLPHLAPGAPLPERVFCPLDPHPLPVNYAQQDGRLHYLPAYRDRLREPGCDIDVCFSGKIAISEIGLGG